MTFVVDNSVAISWCFQDEHTPDLVTLLRRLLVERAMAPMLWPLEALNVLMVSERKRRIDRVGRHRLTAFLRGLPIDIDDETAHYAWRDTQALMERHGLTSYDAAYLELALRTGLSLATLDQDLARAARAEQVHCALDGS